MPTLSPSPLIAQPSASSSVATAPYQPHDEFTLAHFRHELEALAQRVGDDAKPTDRCVADLLDAADPLASMRSHYHLPTLGDICDPAHLDALSPQSPSHPALYMCGNSLGPLPKLSERYINEELDAWRRKAVVGHFCHPYNRPWTSMDLGVAEMCADLVGAKPSEVTVMGTLTGNLHSLLATFYRPATMPYGVGFRGDVQEAKRTGQKVRHKIVYEHKAFPSDRYALASAIELNGFDVDTSLVPLKPRPGRKTLDEQDILDTIDRLGREGETALVLLGGVQFFTGQFFPVEKLAKLAHSYGILFGLDLAHAFCNVPLKLHDWDIDFAAWCTYKYGNSGPGGMGGLFVHQRWTDVADDQQLVRPAGWYGHDRQTRFSMPEEFQPVAGAGGWQVSNGSALDIAALRGALETLFKVKQLVSLPGSGSSTGSKASAVAVAANDNKQEQSEVGYGSVMPILRARSLRLTAYLEMLLTQPGFLPDHIDVKIITPTDPMQRGSQLCIQFPEASDEAPQTQAHQANGMVVGAAEAGGEGEVPPPIDGKKLVARAHARAEKRRGLVADIRHPDILRLAPLAQYSTFGDVYRTAEAVRLSIWEEVEGKA
ncbi:Kynureninase (L-kynurenine hydrolase) [Thecaphora frezii]